MKFLFTIIFILFYTSFFSQEAGKVDTFKLSFDDIVIVHMITENNDTAKAFELKSDLRKDGIYQVFADKTFRQLCFQTRFQKNGKVGYDTYWYPNGVKFRELEAIETVCSDSVNYNTVYFTRGTKPIGQYHEWYPDGRLKVSGQYILRARCDSRMAGKWVYWPEENSGKKMVIRIYPLTEE